MSNLKKLVRGLIIKFKQVNWQDYAWSNLDKTKLLVPFRLFTHPIDTFNDIKNERRGSLAIANALLIIYFIEGIIEYFTTGFLFSNNDVQQFSLASVLISSVVLVVVWTVANWAMSTLLDGSGTFKEIWMVTCYSLIPLVLFRVPISIISNGMTLSENMFYTSFTTIFTIWTLMLLFLGLMVVHDFTASKTLGVCVLTLGMIFIVAFLVLLAFSIYQQISMFVTTIFTELLRR